MARLLADEDFDFPVVEQLRTHGHDVVTARQAGLANRKLSDASILAAATVDGRAVLTRNRRHFVRLHRQGIVHAGIVACSPDRDFAALALRIHQQIDSLSILDGQLVLVNRGP